MNVVLPERVEAKLNPQDARSDFAVGIYSSGRVTMGTAAEVADLSIPEFQRELLRFHASLPTFLKTVAPADEARLSRLRLELDPGEAEAISLACEVKAERLLIDETIGRAVALREGVAIIGLVGVLVTAKQSGWLTSIAPVPQRLEEEAGFRLSQSLKAEALRSVGEA